MKQAPVYIPESEVEIHYFEKLEKAKSEIRHLKVELGKQISYTHELQDRIKALSKSKEEIFRECDSKLQAMKRQLKKAEQIDKPKIMKGLRDQLFYYKLRCDELEAKIPAFTSWINRNSANAASSER